LASRAVEFAVCLLTLVCPAFTDCGPISRKVADGSIFASFAPVKHQAESIRVAAIATHAALLTNGALAAKLRLTIRARNALSSVALGKRNSEAANELGVSERGMTKLLASARSKLNARTNTEAAVKAALVNASVFL
jgi:DNA-binding CsgD family transcriptional regulator